MIKSALAAEEEEYQREEEEEAKGISIHVIIWLSRKVVLKPNCSTNRIFEKKNFTHPIIDIFLANLSEFSYSK